MGGKIWVAAAVLATLCFVVTGQPGFTIYKFSLQWQPTACTGGGCLVQPKEKFTILGLWPANGNTDVLVKPYHDDTTCTGINPSPSGDVQGSIAAILTELEDKWPNLFVGTDNLQLWKTEWENHGMCSDYNNAPGAYFRTSLDLQTRFTNISGDAAIALDVGYLADEIVDKVRQKYGVKPEITCNFDVATRKFKLLEIRFCYNRVWILQDCPNQNDGSCPVSPDKIILPSAPPPLHQQDEPLKKIQ